MGGIHLRYAANEVSKASEIQFAVADVFTFKTIARIAEHVATSTQKRVAIIAQERDVYPLSFAQERLWFIEQFEQGTNAYHIPMFVKLARC